MSRPTVVVVGAGVGGIAAAAHLARSGYDVTVVESRDRPGGRCGRLTFGGHRIDSGPTLYLMPDVYAQTFADLGARVEEYLELHRVDPTYQLHFADGSGLALTSDSELMRSQLEAIEPGSYYGLLLYLEEGREHHRQAMPNLVERNFRRLGEFATTKNLALLFKLKALRRHYRNVGNYFDDPRLKAAFTFQDMYMGLSPFEAPALYSLLQYVEFADGVWYPTGGMYRVVEALVELATRLGVRFLYRSPVDKISLGSDRATGVQLSSGLHFPADVVVANADLSYVYRNLLPDDGSSARLERMRYGCSAIVFYWGLNRRYPQLGVHNLFLGEDYRQSFDPIFKHFTLPDDPGIYVHAPARIDPTAAPEGGDTLMVALPVGHLNPRSPQDWQALQQRAREQAVQRLARLGLDDLEGSIVFERSMLPADWQQQLNLTRGSTHGLSHDLRQMGYLRPRNRHGRYRNLYFVGASTHPGTGVPTVLISARLVAQRIAEECPVRAGQPLSIPAMSLQREGLHGG